MSQTWGMMCLCELEGDFFAAHHVLKVIFLHHVSFTTDHQRRLGLMG